MRGVIVGADVAHPGVLHVEIRDGHGGLWRLATQDAEWSPPAHEQLVGQTVDRAQVDVMSGGLRCDLSGGTPLTLVPCARENSGELPGRKPGIDSPLWERRHAEHLLAILTGTSFLREGLSMTVVLVAYVRWRFASPHTSGMAPERHRVWRSTCGRLGGPIRYCHPAHLPSHEDQRDRPAPSTAASSSRWSVIQVSSPHAT
jgi:hypothetical protein